MNTLTLRSIKGTALSNDEIDGNVLTLAASIGLKLDAIHEGSGGATHANVIADGASGFMTGADKTKLNGIATGANNYVHPANHPASVITQDATNRFVTDTEKATWNGKQPAGTYATGTGTASGVNTGDETLATIKAKLGITTLSGSNTGDQVIPTTLPASDVYAWAKAASKPAYTATEIGLGNVTNTSDANKPVSTAQQAALDLKINSTGPATITASGTSAALTITQLGTGSALVVEDAAGDTTPFIIDQNGRVVSGHTAALGAASGLVPRIQAVGANNSDAAIGLVRFSADAAGNYITLSKSRSATIGTYGASVASGDVIGSILWAADDGVTATPVQAASIFAQVDGTPATGSMPGRLIFSTTPTGSANPVERMRIDAKGTIGIGIIPSLASKIQISDTVTDTTQMSTYHQVNYGATSGSTSYIAHKVLAVPNASFAGTGVLQTMEASVTNQSPNAVTQVRGFSTGYTSTAGSALGVRYGFLDNGLTLTSGTVGTNYGFVTASTATATNNYGFVGQLPYAANTYNLYMSGTADNYLGGSLGIGAQPIAGRNLIVSKSLTGSTGPYGILVAGNVQSDVTVGATVVGTSVGTAAATFTLPILKHYSAQQGTFGAGSTVTNQYGFLAESTLTGATNNYGFYGSIPAGTGRYNFYAVGTADNYMAGHLGIGALAAPPPGFAKFIAIGDSDSGIGQISDGVIALATNNVERLRIDNAGNITQKIGASFTTGGNLTVNTHDGSEGGQISLSNKTNTAAQWIFDVDANNHGRLFTTQNDSNLSLGQLAGTGGEVKIYTAATERMRIDAAGNVGIGMLPIMSSSANLYSTADISLSGTTRTLFGNVYYASGWKYHGNGTGCYIKLASSATNALELGVLANNTGGAGAVGTPISALQIDSSGNVGIGQDPSSWYGAPARFVAVANGNASSNFGFGNNTIGASAAITFRLIGGTGNSYIDQVLNDGNGAPTSQTSFGAAISSHKFVFGGTERLRLTSGGNVLVTGSGGLGYGTGSGGTVTQATSKSTAVTLNKPSGRITTAADALAAGAYVSFIVTNSLIDAGDIVIVNMAGGVSSFANYRVSANWQAVGAFVIAIENRTAGSLSEAVVINFAIIKGAIA